MHMVLFSVVCCHFVVVIVLLRFVIFYFVFHVLHFCIFVC